ncbi:hypothetical protein CCACVL1_03343 [Corchorus capsularis]|uniref:Uncharacterized protein n=1 Tax=Corchorus capsularis TaxID=210143 RepID=A0A1R3K0B7_COCAP|nr:hypothetical protein CCACVL1_03343 [Corchorus capsularis]
MGPERPKITSVLNEPKNFTMD